METGVRTAPAPAMIAGRYELGEVIGHGGSGLVYRAVDSILGRQVAVKVLSPELAASGAAHVARFEREARAAGSLIHPAIVTVYDSGSDGGCRYIVMEHVEGQSLSTLIREQAPLDSQRALAICDAIAAALEQAHRAGIVHRDIKPGNVMIARDGSVKVLDFGIARSRGATTLTDVHKVLGTATYISPEQACGERAEERSDLYSLGCVLFAMLTGRPPFSGEDPAAVLERHLVEEPPALARAGAVGVAAGVEALLRSLLAKAPADRPADAAQVRERIASLRAGNAGAGLTRRRPARPRRATGAAAGATVPGELTPRRVWGRRRRRGRRLAGGVALASPLVVLALALALSAENRGPLPARASGAGAHRTPASHRATSSPQVPAPAPKSGTAGGPSESARATVTDGPSKAADGPAGKHGKGHHRGHRHGGRGDGHDGKGAPDG